MSKMSQLHAELTQQANELGFESIEEAEANGYHIDYTSKGWKLKLDMAKAHEQAHNEWLADKEIALQGLTDLLEDLEKNKDEDWKSAVVEFAIDLIKKGEV